MYKFAKEQHENTLKGDGYKTSEEQETAEAKLSQGEKDVDEFNKQLQELDKKIIEVDFEAEAFAFLTIQIQVVLANYVDKEGNDGINGRQDLYWLKKYSTHSKAFAK